VAGLLNSDEILKEVTRKLCPVPYYDIMGKSKDPKSLSYQMVCFALTHGIKATGRAFEVSRKSPENGSDAFRNHQIFQGIDIFTWLSASSLSRT
jgi:hypothetical protein